MGEVQLKPSSEWAKVYDMKIQDPDGWDRKNFEEDWARPISWGEFTYRAMRSTLVPWTEWERPASLSDRVETLEEFARSVDRWSKAYPKATFPEPTPEQVDEVCKTLGFRIDRISAMILREFTKPWGEAARKALGEEADV